LRTGGFVEGSEDIAKALLDGSGEASQEGSSPARPTAMGDQGYTVWKSLRLKSAL